MALTALMAGVFVYLGERSGSGVYFLPESWQAIWSPSWIGLHLPGFLHTFAFSILTAVALVPSRSVVAASCVVWVFVNSLFEFGQVDTVAAEITRYTPAWLGNWPVLENLNSYLLAGTFDPVDVVFVVLGGAAAFFTMTACSQAGDSK